jgi:hypothetical protein
VTGQGVEGADLVERDVHGDESPCVGPRRPPRLDFARARDAIAQRASPTSTARADADPFVVVDADPSVGRSIARSRVGGGGDRANPSSSWLWCCPVFVDRASRDGVCPRSEPRLNTRIALPPRAAQLARSTADNWARKAGFDDAAAVPFGRAAAMIADVAATTKLSPAAVQQALLDAAAETTDAARAALAQTGAAGAYRGAQDRRPLSSAEGATPMGTLLQARNAGGAQPTSTKPTPSTTPSTTAADVVFHQTVADFEAARIVLTQKATPKTVREVHDGCARLLKLFDSLDGSRKDAQVKDEIVRTYRDLMSLTARGKGVFVAKSTDDNPLPSFQRTTNDPSMPDGAARAGRTDLGRGALVAFDAASGTPYVYDHGGEVKEIASIGEFVTRRADEIDADRGADAVAAEPTALEALRSLTDKELARLPGDVDYVSLLEDGKNDLTRVYATKWGRDSGDLLSRRVVVEGPFKGIFLDDLANEVARRGGKGADLDPKKGELPLRPTTGEAFITATKVKERGEIREKLMVRIPDNREWTEVRRSLRRLSELDPSVKYKDGSGNTTFVFGADHYKLVRDVVKGTVVAGPARALLQEHFDELSRIERVTDDKNLAQFTPGKIGGFKARVEGADGKVRDLDFTYWQKKSIAWLASNDYKGVIALGTGMGKTLVALGAVQHLSKTKDDDRPVLVVGPPGLGGNMAAEARKFLEPKAADAFVKRLRFMDFAEFSKAVRAGKDADGKKFDSDQFGAVIFDEAHKIANRKTVGGAAALAFKHDHKIVMTASAMTRGIDETMTLIAIANNKDLNDRVEGKDERYQIRKFTNLHLRIVGGRAVGVTDAVELQPGEKVDPKHNMHSFIRANVLYADKRMDEHKLSKFTLTTEALVMPPKMEDEYKKRSKNIAKVLRGMVSLYRDQGVKREFVDERGRTRREIEPLAKDKRIAQMFGTQLRETILKLNELTNNPAKLDRAADVVRGHLSEKPSSRAVLFSDDPDYVLSSAATMSKKIPGKLHAACLGKEIHFFQDGKRLTELDGHKLPFVKQPYTDASGRSWDANQWQKFVLDQVIGKNHDVTTTTLFGPIYQEGQNLQWASVGVHLDRDTWSRQNMEQREGRLWRKGQDKPVAFYNLDWQYKKPADQLDRTLDEVRGLYDDVNGKLFHDVIVVPQALELGGEWEGVRQQADLRVDRDVVALALQADLGEAAAAGGWT